VLSSSEETPIYGNIELSLLIPSLNPELIIRPLLFVKFFKYRSIGVFAFNYYILNLRFVNLFEVTVSDVFSIE
jgi:hypothetical protein